MDSTTNQGGKKIYKKWWFWVLVVVIALFLIGSIGSKPTTSVPAPAENGTSTPAGVSSAQQTLLDISGSGTKTTAKFTAASDWDLNWSYDCSNFGMQGNFIVTVYESDGSPSFSNTGVNQLGKTDSGVEHYHKGGTYYLVLNSECKWKVSAQG